MLLSKHQEMSSAKTRVSFIQYITDITPLSDEAVGTMGCCSGIAGYDLVWVRIQSQTYRNLKKCEFGKSNLALSWPNEAKVSAMYRYLTEVIICHNWSTKRSSLPAVFSPIYAGGQSMHGVV